MKLTARNIAALTLPEGQDERMVFDEDLPGFGYRLRARDGRVHKTFVFRYRNTTGQTRKYLIGPGIMPIAAARDRALELLVQVKRGEDPQGDKTAARERELFGFRRVLDDFIADRERFWRRGTAINGRHKLLVLCKPLHGKAINEITRADLSSLIRFIETNHGLCTAKQTRGWLNTLFAWAMQEGHLEQNPIIGARKVAYDGRRDRALSDDEIARVWRATSDPTLAPHGGRFGAIVRLLLLTGCRRNEVANMQWAEIDARGYWTIPAERSKNKRAHTLALPPAALSILEEMRGPRWSGRNWENDGYVFSKAINMNITPSLRILQELCGFANWRIHDLRRTVATGMGRINIPPHVVECVLNHMSGFRAGVAGVYNRNPYEREMAQALQRWSEHVLALAEDRADKVVPLRAS